MRVGGLPSSSRALSSAWFYGAGCRVQGAGCRVQGAGCRVQGVGCRVVGVGLRVDGVPSSSRALSLAWISSGKYEIGIPCPRSAAVAWYHSASVDVERLR